MTTALKQHAHMQELIDQMQTVVLDADSMVVDDFVRAYRLKFGLGERDRSNERATLWRGVQFEGRTIAVFGERQTGRALEVTDAYHDGTREGLAAFTSLAFGYYAMLQSGVIDELVHLCLWANEEHWRAIIRETGDPPSVLIFVHHRKEQG